MKSKKKFFKKSIYPIIMLILGIGIILFNLEIQNLLDQLFAAPNSANWWDKIVNFGTRRTIISFGTERIIGVGFGWVLLHGAWLIKNFFVAIWNVSGRYFRGEYKK